MTSADAIKTEELYKDNANDRRELLNTLKAMHAGTQLETPSLRPSSVLCTHLVALSR